MGNNWQGAVRVVARTGVFTACTTSLLAIEETHRYFVGKQKRPEVLDAYLRKWAGLSLQLFGVQWSVQTTEGQYKDTSPRKSVGRLIIANHRSPIDVILLQHLFGGHALSRADLARWPLLGLSARRAGTLFVDRSNSGSRLSALREIRNRLDGGATLLVFPEGATFAGDEVRPFNRGAFLAASEGNTEVVSVGIAYEPGCEFVDESFAQHLGRIAARKVTRVYACVGSTRSFEPGTKAATIAETIRGEVQLLTHRARSWLNLGSPL